LKFKRLISAVLTVFPVLLVGSCKTISSFVHEGRAVARVGRHKLYSPELDAYIPNGIPPEDSVKMARQYIETWASDMLFMDLAQEELSKSDLDVSKELEDYKRSLIKYRFEQNYVNKMLDTTITSKEIQNYYESHQDNFRLQRPIAKATFMTIPQGSPNLDAIRKKISSDKDEDLLLVDSLAFASAIRTTNYGGKWVDVTAIARDFGTDWETVKAHSKEGVVEMNDDNGNVLIAYISSMMPAGETAPIEFCSDQIRDIILSNRKHELVTGLEQDLLDKARTKGKFETYDKDEQDT
jgi:hypothetical protein